MLIHFIPYLNLKNKKLSYHYPIKRV